MKPYQHDMIEMQADKLARNSIELFCLTSILEEILGNSYGNLPGYVITTFTSLVKRQAKYLQLGAIKLHCDIEHRIKD